MKSAIFSTPIRVLLGLSCWAGHLANAEELLAREPVIVLLRPQTAGASREETDFIWELFQNALADVGMTVVDRTRLTEVMRELALDNDGFTPQQQSRIGRFLSADYLIETRLMELNQQKFANVRVIDVTSTRVLGDTLPMGDAEDLLKDLSQLAGKTTGVLNRLGVATARDATSEFALPDIPESWKGLKVAVVIPEEHLPRPIPDPAAETRLIEHLTHLGLHVVDLPGAEPRGITADGLPADLQRETREVLDKAIKNALERDVQILILGEAFSQRSGQLRNFVSCRARVELRVVHVESGQILFAGSATHGHSDTSEFAAAKSALEKSADDLSVRILTAMKSSPRMP